MLEILKQIFSMALKRKKFFLIPIFIFVFIFSVLLIFAQSSPIAPFIYTIF